MSQSQVSLLFVLSLHLWLFPCILHALMTQTQVRTKTEGPAIKSNKNKEFMYNTLKESEDFASLPQY